MSLRSRPLAVRSTLVAVTLVLLSSCGLVGGGSTYTVKAEFSRTVGLYPGSFVRQLGIDIGSVTDVVNHGDHIEVTMSVMRSHPLGADAKAILVGNSVLGERFVQFTPAYTGGPRLADGAVVPIDRTAVPVETDEVLRSLQRVLGAVDPKNVKDLVTNLADIVNGQGAQLNELIANASGTLGLLADKSTDLGQLTNSLASLTGALRTRTDALASLIRDYDTVSQIIADDRQQVDGTVTQLTSATGQAAALLSTNLPGLKDDIAALTTAGQSLDRNIDSLDTGLANTPRLFSAAKRAYDPAHQWLPLNTQSSPTVTSAVLAARIRDSLAGICRRLAVKDPALAPQLAACGNPNSGFFDPVLNIIPGVLATLPGQTAPAGRASSSQAGAKAGTAAAATAVPAIAAAAVPVTAADAFAAGLAAIPGLSQAERGALTALPSSGASGLSGPAAVSPLDVSQALPARPALADAPRPHRGIVSRFLSWLGGLL